jgi:hypothetical protein
VGFLDLLIKEIEFLFQKQKQKKKKKKKKKKKQKKNELKTYFKLRIEKLLQM